MAEIVGTALGIADVAFRVIGYLDDIRKAMGTISEDIEGLRREVESMKATHEQLEQELSQGRIDPSTYPGASTLRAQTVRVLRDATNVVEKLEHCILELYGRRTDSTSTMQRLRQTRKKMASDDRLGGFRDQIQSHNGSLNLWLNIIQLFVSDFMVSQSHS